MVFLVGGWVVAQAVQPPGYDPIRQTISALARSGLAHRWIMTTGLAGLGAAHVVTAAGLAALPSASRAVLATGGLATLAVAAFAQPHTGSSAVHIGFATLGFVVLAIWPATAARRGAGGPRRPAVAFAAAGVSLALLAWVGLTQSGGPLGLAERLLTFDQAFWPFVVVVALRRRRPLPG
jgi:hypothetical membrane protein